MTTRVCKATLLKSMKKGKTPVQCSHKAKNGTDYCGYHRNFITKKDLPPQNPPPPPQNPPPDSIECVICWSDITTKDLVRTKCNHCFHSKCLEQWKKRANTCPCCRALLPSNRAEFNGKGIRDFAIQKDMRTLISLRDNAVVGSYTHEMFKYMIEIRNYEDSMNAIY